MFPYVTMLPYFRSGLLFKSVIVAHLLLNSGKMGCRRDALSDFL